MLMSQFPGSLAAMSDCVENMNLPNLRFAFKLNSHINRSLVFLTTAIALSACSGGATGIFPIEESLMAGKITADAPPDPPTGAVKTGAYPVIGRQRQAETTQMTKAEKAAMKSELSNAITVNAQSETERARAEYQAEIRRMKKLFDYQNAQRKSQIF